LFCTRALAKRLRVCIDQALQKQDYQDCDGFLFSIYYAWGVVPGDFLEYNNSVRWCVADDVNVGLILERPICAKGYAKRDATMTMQTKEDLLQLVTEHQQQIRALGVKRCGLFGSFVHAQHTPHSDVDVLVEFEPDKKTFMNFMRLAFLLEDLFGRKVDLITLESLSPYIGPYILQEVEYAAIGA
jgi:predicted nucleotidyltransferase